MTTTDRSAEELLRRASDDLLRLTETWGGPWEFADRSAFTVERFAADSSPQPVTREVGGTLVTVGYRYSAVLLRPAGAGTGPSADEVADAVARIGFRVTDAGPAGPGRHALTAVDESGARLAVQGSPEGTRVVYSSPGSGDPSLPAVAEERARTAFDARRRRDARQNPYLDAVYAERDARRSSGRDAV